MPSPSDTTDADASAAIRLAAFAREFDEQLATCPTGPTCAPERFQQAMRYALLSPGKRLRPFLVYECCRVCGGRDADALPPAVAVELVHAFSLTHDDLPAMDDDDLRRGRPTTHKQFDEATAILTGDALLILAFEVLADRVSDPTRAQAMVLALARGAGWQGMTGGQAADLEGEHHPPDLDRVQAVHAGKTAALLAAACRLGAIAAGAASAEVERMARYGHQLGMCFQIIDDLLDVGGTAEEAGKATGKDAARHKQTYPASVGEERSRQFAEAAAAAAVAELAEKGGEADLLRSLARFVCDRTR